MENPTPLGHFAYFPYEIRELLWLQFVPSGQDNAMARHHQKTDLSILCTSQALHDEVSKAMYGKSHLVLTIAPKHKLDEKWMTVEFSQRHYSQTGGSDSTIPPVQKARWVIKSTNDAGSRGFYNLPFHQISQITVNLGAPNPNDPGELFTLWQGITKVVRLIKRAITVRCLLIRLGKCDGQDWIDDAQWPNQSMLRIDDHDVVTVPFCSLNNVEQQIYVDAHYSDQLVDVFEWRTTTEVISNSRWAHHCSHATIHGADADVKHKCAEYYFRLHKALWMHADSSIAGGLRLQLLRKWYAQGSNGVSDLERGMAKIARVYPEIIERHDSDMGFLTAVLICANHYAQEADHWDSVFQGGIPSASSDGFDKFDVLDISKCMEKGGFLSRIAHFVEDWENASV